MLAGGFVAAVSGIFLIFAWLQNRKATAPLWWAGANLALASGVVFITSGRDIIGVPAMVYGTILLQLSPALIWGAAVSCSQRKPNVAIVAAGSIIWLGSLALVFTLSRPAEMWINLILISVYLFAAAFEFWAGRSERVMARWPLIVLLLLHGLFFAAGAFVAAMGTLSMSNLSMNSWFGLIHFETLFFVVGTAIFTVAMVKEQSELVHMTAASVDPLTGVATRRAFMSRAASLLADARSDGEPISLVVFDLDHFKSINDTFGHAMGDRVLERFGETARGIIRGSDLIGRPGGEEFAVVFPGMSAGAAYVAAERIRVGFTAACSGLAGEGFRATASAGLAVAHPDSTLDSLFAAADRALYDAKARGRDQVAIADRDRTGSLRSAPGAAAAAAAA